MGSVAWMPAATRWRGQRIGRNADVERAPRGPAPDCGPSVPEDAYTPPMWNPHPSSVVVVKGGSARAAPEFIDRLIAHDAQAFEELVRAQGPRLLAVASRYLPRPADAEDALQDAFVSVVRSISGFQRASSLETWLHRVVVNASLMILRRRRRKPETSLDEATVEGGASSPSRRGSPLTAHDAIERAETRLAVRHAVDGLPASQRSILLLRDVDALELKSIATLLDVGVSTVKVRLHRARQALQLALGPDEAEALG